jgi:hypothetical protein
MGNYVRNALDNYRSNREVAIWNLELRTIGKWVCGQFMKMISNSHDVDQLEADIKFFDQLILILERKLEVAN